MAISRRAAEWSLKRARSLGRRSEALLPAGMLAAVIALRVSGFPAVEYAQLRAFDAFQQLRPRVWEDAGVRIVDIDDESLSRLGQWPWPRPLLARMISLMAEHGAAAIAFDAVFPEPDRTSPARVVESWPEDPALAGLKRRVRALPDHDRVLARAVAKAPVVLGFSLVPESNGGVPKAKATFVFGGDGPLSYLPDWEGAIVNIPPLEKAAPGIGSIGYQAEHDGVIRRVPLLFRRGKTLLPSLALEALRVAQKAPSVGVKTSGSSGEATGGQRTGIVKVKVGRFTAPTDEQGRVWVHYPPAGLKERVIPAWQVFEKDFDRSRLKGTIAFVGTGASGLKDLRATPLNPAAPGVEVHADVAEQLVLGKFLERPDWAAGAELFYMAAVGLLLLLILSRAGAALSAPVFLAMAAAAVGASWKAYVGWGRLLDPVFPVLALFAVYFPWSAVSFVRSERDKRRITDTFGRYLSPKVVAKIAAKPGAVELGGETRQMTFHFCDIRGFTTISEKFDPHGLTEFINAFLTPMTQIILDHDGTIDKYMGDCIMAFWNAPMDVPDHARQACRAALRMHERLKELNERWQAEAAAEGRTLPLIEIGTGLNTGPCVVGNMGSTLRVDYTVLGDDVNLASRLEGQSKSYGVKIVIGPLTREQAPDFAALELDLIKVKGKTKPVRIFALLDAPEAARGEAFSALLKEHDAMLAAYRRQDWGAVRAALPRLEELGAPWKLSKLYHLYEERARAYLQDPPGQDWDGVFVATSK